MFTTNIPARNRTSTSYPDCSVTAWGASVHLFSSLGQIRLGIRLKQEYYNVISHCAENMHYSAFYQAWHHHFYMRLAIKFLQRYWWYITLYALGLAVLIKIPVSTSNFLEKALDASVTIFPLIFASIFTNSSRWQIVIAHCNRARLLRIIQNGVESLP